MAARDPQIGKEDFFRVFEDSPRQAQEIQAMRVEHSALQEEERLQTQAHPAHDSAVSHAERIQMAIQAMIELDAACSRTGIATGAQALSEKLKPRRFQTDKSSAANLRTRPSQLIKHVYARYSYTCGRHEGRLFIADPLAALRNGHNHNHAAAATGKHSDVVYHLSDHRAMDDVFSLVVSRRIDQPDLLTAVWEVRCHRFAGLSGTGENTYYEVNIPPADSEFPGYPPPLHLNLRSHLPALQQRVLDFFRLGYVFHYEMLCQQRNIRI
jgi:hypothetical protein